ncbi:hypothetical protein MUK42_34742 [Musa troglodytarum]|uniref:Uncharacterized protein n=1 Tax=Musa troglodytarum TaxID=320322 RepID=A0A9E7L016_9LILI|nr:hypothetical protein MUK42_34742 [Musa troglodytarum]
MGNVGWSCPNNINCGIKMCCQIQIIGKKICFGCCRCCCCLRCALSLFNCKTCSYLTSTEGGNRYSFSLILLIFLLVHFSGFGI